MQLYSHLVMNRIFNKLDTRIGDRFANSTTLEGIGGWHKRLFLSLYMDLALVFAELPCWYLGQKHLIDFFKCPILGFGNVEKTKCSSQQTAWEPDISVLRAPVEFRWVAAVSSELVLENDVRVLT